ncbi:hypothetical protein CLOM_g16360, partial [Closterium sp. NIES-68]
LGHNWFFGSLPDSLSKLSSLVYLSANRNGLNGSIPQFLGNLHRLTYLGLSDNTLSGSLPAFLGNLSSLVHLSASQSTLSGSIPEELGNLHCLTYLTLSHQKLSGAIPESIGALTNLEYLDLKFNRLTGTIPASIANLTRLTELVLSNNFLAGSLPAALSALTNLEEVSLEYNQLAGSLPSFHHLSRLSRLKASNNYLTGRAAPFPECLSPDRTSACPHDCLYPPTESDIHGNCLVGSTFSCEGWQKSSHECRLFCGARPLTPPCSGHGVCSFEPGEYHNMPAMGAQCTCDEGYMGAAGTCVPRGSAFVWAALSALQAPRNLLLLLVLLPLAVLLLLAFSLPQFLRRFKNKPHAARYFFSKKAVAARRAALCVEVTS